MNILCVGYLHGSGGAERQIIMLANALSERGHKVSLAVLAEFNSTYTISEKVKVFDLTFVEKYKFLGTFGRYFALRRVIKFLQPDIIINYWFQSAYLCTFMPSTIDGKIIYAERSDPGDKQYNGLLGVIRKIAFKYIDGFVFQSEGARDYFGSSLKRKSIIIHNSVFIPENEFLEPCTQRKKKIINVGRLNAQKNQQLLIKAFARIEREIPGYILEIYGDGELRDVLLKMIYDLNLQDRIFLKGTTSNILNCMYNASLFVLSSDFEGMPNALMEAMGIGVPSISTDCKPGGARTLILNGINGWITPIGDELALSKRIKSVLLDTELANRVAKEGMKIRKSHTQYQIFNQWEEYLQSITESGV